MGLLLRRGKKPTLDNDNGNENNNNSKGIEM